ncbi:MULTISPECIES: pirin family protein [unclassified Idiomarina]|uniref:pirin family protein n=1 Tax=unclassified Idiomarina TaxID=2614829 RepID=UPI000C8BB508|nr:MULTISPECIES: pirin family protein [unclassified Idiomarina]MAD54332.1 hypothetical protein [Idiomarinaceae bacterium]NQZ03880.1 pirin family protein [Idiomarina sp.]|tara:strand:+ start:1392 stop:2219 length:828 start_codon:yes stop_codon:yes gene_type:complete
MGIVKRVKGIAAQDGAGVKLSRIINQPTFKHQDPFLMLDEFRSDDPDDYIAGFPPHPHRGFCTLTYMLAGQMAHEDSVGNQGLVGAGGVQWMKAARGIIHAEMPKQTDGLMWGFQLWINLPAKYKMDEPEWFDYKTDTIPEVELQNGILRLIAGNYDDKQGPVSLPEQRLFIADLRLNEKAREQLALAQHTTQLMYVYQGALLLDGERVERGELAVLDRQAATLDVTADQDSGAMILMGDALGESISQYGPFVMNTPEEIEQAIRDYQQGKLTQG